MTKAEFLDLSAGQQRWVLFQAVRMTLGLLIPPRISKSRVRLILASFDTRMDQAAQEEMTDEKP